MIRLLSATALAAAILLAAPARAEVVATSEIGFVSRNAVEVSTKPDVVWNALVAPSGWWSPQHTYSGDSANLSLEAQVGGCFCEKLPPAANAPAWARAGGVEHLRVIHVDPGRVLRLSGGLGPLQAEAVAGTLTVTLKPTEKGTRILFEYVVGGYMRFPVSDIAPQVDRVLMEQVGRLALKLEPGLAARGAAPAAAGPPAPAGKAMPAGPAVPSGIPARPAAPAPAVAPAASVAPPLTAVTPTAQKPAGTALPPAPSSAGPVSRPAPAVSPAQVSPPAPSAGQVGGTIKPAQPAASPAPVQAPASPILPRAAAPAPLKPVDLAPSAAVPAPPPAEAAAGSYLERALLVRIEAGALRLYQQGQAQPLPAVFATPGLDARLAADLAAGEKNPANKGKVATCVCTGRIETAGGKQVFSVIAGRLEYR